MDSHRPDHLDVSDNITGGSVISTTLRVPAQPGFVPPLVCLAEIRLFR